MMRSRGIVWSSYEKDVYCLVALSLSFPSRGGGFAICRAVRPSVRLACSLAGSLALGIGVEFGVRVKTSLQSPVTSLSERARVFRIERREGTATDSRSLSANWSDRTGRLSPNPLQKHSIIAMSRKLVLLCLFGAAVAETPVAYDNPAAVDPNYYQGE